MMKLSEKIDSRRRRLSAGWHAALLAISLPLALLACSGGGGNADGAAASAPSTATGTQQLASASILHTLEVPEALAQPPFNETRTLTVPPGFGIRVWARVPKARFMALAPNGDVLVSRPDNGTIVLLRERTNDVPQQFDFAAGLQNPHDMVFHQINNVTYLYIAESNRISRVVYQPGMTSIGDREVVVDNLPDDSTPELRGNYGHQLKNIALGLDHKLYVSVASAGNADAGDTVSDPVRGAIYQYDADGKNRRLYATGLRNAEGLDILPGNGALWVAVNNRDEVKVPLDIDVDGDGISDLGQIVGSYVDDHPPEPFTSVRSGGNYGWPFCNSQPNASMSNLDSLPDFDLNRQSENLDCSTTDKPSKGILAHSAPLGLSFLHNTNVPAAYRKGAAIALHGCWNCTTLRAGYKVIYFPFDDSGNAGSEIDLVTGFVTNPQNRDLWGRPVDVIADSKGNLLISDDYAGAIYQLYPK